MALIFTITTINNYMIDIIVIIITIILIKNSNNNILFKKKEKKRFSRLLSLCLGLGSNLGSSSFLPIDLTT